MYKTIYKTIDKTIYETIYKTIYKRIYETIDKTMYETKSETIYKTIHNARNKSSNSPWPDGDEDVCPMLSASLCRSRKSTTTHPRCCFRTKRRIGPSPTLPSTTPPRGRAANARPCCRVVWGWLFLAGLFYFWRLFWLFVSFFSTLLVLSRPFLCFFCAWHPPLLSISNPTVAVFLFLFRPAWFGSIVVATEYIVAQQHKQQQKRTTTNNNKRTTTKKTTNVNTLPIGTLQSTASHNSKLSAISTYQISPFVYFS